MTRKVSYSDENEDGNVDFDGVDEVDEAGFIFQRKSG